MTFPCSHCRSPLIWSEEAAGQTIVCPQCSREMTAPAADPSAPAEVAEFPEVPGPLAPEKQTEKPAPSGSLLTGQAPWWAYLLAIVAVGGLIFYGATRNRSQGTQAAQRDAALAQAKKIATAIAQFEKRSGHYPTVYTADARRRPLLSWRVQILPMLGYQELYNKFNQDEPWDGPINARLIDQIPAEFQNPGFSLPTGHTCWLAVEGSRTVLVRRELVPPAAQKPGIITSLIPDSAAMTIAFVEAAPVSAVPWTSPGDLELDLEQPWRGLGEERLGKASVAGFADGSAHVVEKTVSPELLLRLFLRDDRESVEEFFK